MRDNPRRKVQSAIELLHLKLENQFGEHSFELRLLNTIIKHINVEIAHDLTHEEEICLALADAYDNT